MSDGVTIIQVARALGVSPTASQAWSAGGRAAAAYRLEHGAWPPKELRPKTAGIGSHCLAVYPAAFVPEITSILLDVCGPAPQQGLFGEGSA